jgi:hypothetical protein
MSFILKICLGVIGAVAAVHDIRSRVCAACRRGLRREGTVRAPIENVENIG